MWLFPSLSADFGSHLWWHSLSKLKRHTGGGG